MQKTDKQSNFYISRAIPPSFSERAIGNVLITFDNTFGGWSKTQKEHFADGGIFDKIYTRK
jgi:sulfate transport system substrate-binding protein